MPVTFTFALIIGGLFVAVFVVAGFWLMLRSKLK
jgi:hypothetical protein